MVPGARAHSGIRGQDLAPANRVPGPRRVTTCTVIPLLFLLLALSGCSLDKEASVRAQLGKWVVLGDTSYFRSQKQCTAGLFQTRASKVKSKIVKVSSIDRGLRQIGKGRAVAFVVAGMTPAALHRELDQANRIAGLAILISGLGARGCLTPELKSAFAVALGRADVVLMYDPQNNAMALFETAAKRVFYARGQV